MTRGGNLGRTGLARRRRAGDAMADYDGAPAPLRAWLAGAALPWAPRSARRAFARALARRGGDAAAALADLDRIEARRISDAASRASAAAAG